MKISTKLRGSAVLIICIVFIFGGTALYISVKAGQAGERNQIAQKILETSVMGTGLRVEYGLTGEDRPKVQWYALQITLSNILDQVAPFFTEPVNQALFAAIRDNQERKKVTFDAVVVALEHSDNRELVARLNSQLAVTVQNGVSVATRLAKLSSEEHSALHQILKATVGVLGLFTILFALIFYFVSRRISSSLTTLQQEFIRIASLDFSSTTTTTTTTTGSNDEIGQVARALNRMVEKLKESYGILEEKVKERTIKIAEAKAKDEAILASIGDGMVVVDKEGKITYVNQTFEKMVGWKMQEALDKYSVEVVPREDEKGDVIPFKERVLSKVLSGEKVIINMASPYYYIRRDKSRFPVISIIAPIVLEGKIFGAVETFRDITKEKGIDKAKTEFISLASHQLRTPLGIIKWYLEALRAEKTYSALPDRLKEYIETVHTQNSRLIELVRDMLDVSRIEKGTAMNEPAVLDPLALLKDVIQELQIEALKKKITIDLKAGSESSSLKVDKEKLFDVFSNLLVNALKYNKDKGKVHIVYAVQKHTITVEFTDTGVGIPKEDQHSIFEKFFRARNAVLSNTMGSGLGLYMVKSYVEQWGGRVSFTSILGKGSTFVVTIPLNINYQS